MINRIVGVTAILVGLLVVAACERRQYTPGLSLTSPGGVYVVDIFGPFSLLSVPIVEHRVCVTARRGALVLAARHEVHFADWFDEAFSDEYGRPSWIAENAIRFPAKWPSPEPTDAVRIQNRASRPVSFLRVQCADLLVLFDLQPGVAVQYPVTSQQLETDSRSWLLVSGEWTSGRHLPQVGQNFDVVARPQAYLYTVTITDDAIRLMQTPLQRP